MKRRHWVTLLAVLAAFAAHGGEVGADEAESAALAFARQNALLRGRVTGVGTPKAYGADIWVVPLRPRGYVALEADDTRFPVAAFSSDNDFPAADALPPALAGALWRMPALRPAFLQGGRAWAAPETRHPAWAALLGQGSGTIGLLAFDPTEGLPEGFEGRAAAIDSFTSAWDQSLPWNLYAPAVDVEDGDDAVGSLAEYGRRCAIGCVAVAMAQTGAWFRWPYALRGTTVRAQQADAWDGTLASVMVASPGAPYDWDAIHSAPWFPVSDSGGAFTRAGAEAARLAYHWATLLDTAYDDSGSGGTFAVACRPILAFTMGYKMLFKECVRLTPSGGEPATEDELDPGLHDTFRAAIFDYAIPAPTGISGHQIVCCGWADSPAVDSAIGALAKGVSYAKMNYGWGQGSGGWLAIRDNIGEDGESLSDDGMVFPMENAAILPFQCGQIVGLPASHPLPDAFRWYESPYWLARQSAQGGETPPVRTLRVRTFSNETADLPSDLAIAAESDPNWTWEPATETTPARLSCEERNGLSTGVLLPELFHGGESIAIDLQRVTDGDGDPVSNAAAASALTLFIQYEPSGDYDCLGAIALPEGEDGGTCDIALPDRAADGAFRLVIATEDAEEDGEDTEDVASRPKGTYAGPAFAIAAVTVRDTAVPKDAAFRLAGPEGGEAAVDLTADGMGAGTFRTEADREAFLALGQGERPVFWLAVAVDKAPDEALKSGELLWSSFTSIPETLPPIEPPVIDLPKTVFLGEDPAAPIPFDLRLSPLADREGLDFTVTVSDGLWAGIDPDAPNLDGAAADAFLRNVGTVDHLCTDAADQDHHTYALTLTLDPDALASYAAIGHDAILSIRVMDDTGNSAWAHARLANRIPEAALTGQADALTGEPLTGWSAATLDTLMGAFATHRPETPAAEAFATIAALADFRYDYDTVLGLVREPAATLPKPAIDILSVGPDVLRFRFIDASKTTEAERSASAAEIIGREGFAFAIEVGEDLDTLAGSAPILPLDGLDVATDGTVTLPCPAPQDAPSRFYRIRASQNRPDPDAAP